MASLEDQIRTLLESRNKKEAEKKEADRMDEDPAVKIENPMDPNLQTSEGLTPDQEEAEEAEGVAGGDANEREVEAKKKAEGMREEADQSNADAEQRFEAEKAQAQATDVNGDLLGDSLAQVQAVQNQTDVDQSNADAEQRFEAEKAEADAMREDTLANLFGQDFSEDFKLKATTIFEAAIKEKVEAYKAKLNDEHTAKMTACEEEYTLKADALQKEFQEKYEAHAKTLEEETSEKIDGYLSYVAEEWTTKNELALEAGIKTELTESFINQLKSLFEQHYIEVPESKVDLYAKSLEEKAALEEELSNAVSSLKTLKEELNIEKRAHIIEESVKDFASLDASRFKTLVEDFEFEDEDTFRKKVGIVKKSFFENKQSTAKEQLTEELVKTEVITEQGSSTIEQPIENSRMSAYVSALKK